MRLWQGLLKSPLRLRGREVRGCATLMGASEFTSEAEGREVRGCATLIAF